MRETAAVDDSVQNYGIASRTAIGKIVGGALLGLLARHLLSLDRSLQFCLASSRDDGSIELLRVVGERSKYGG